MSSIHKHLIQKRKPYKVKIVEGRSDRPYHIVYGLWASVLIFTLLKARKRGKVGKRDAMKSYEVMIRSLGML